MEVKRVRVTNRKQFQLLVDQMEAHPAVAKGLKFCVESGYRNEAAYNGVWKNIATELNSMGPPIRSPKEWQKVWTDFKLKIKNKLVHNKREANATGGGPNKMKVLSPIEEAVAKLLSLDKTVNHSGSTFGLPRHVTSPINQPGSPLLSSTRQQLMIDEANLLEEEDLPELDEPSDEEVETVENTSTHRSTERTTNTKQRKRQDKSNQDLRNELLVEQTKLMKKIAENSTECARYARKMYKLREEEFKHQREHSLRKENDRKEELEFKMELLKYKQRKLDLLERRERKH
ncbi:uncharacterized protein LOC5574104 [Aedes aegypti]|uniref:Regulatory protein zeste n=1 Tax=Aedes aegypti TaxID=7159 RepID=A0A1S4F177_AEDAE|nr:uncharacterized protein LOC5574104 [Aedes aegypti]